MTLTLSPLPFAPTALEPHMSARTLEFHHGKHHKAYVDNTNAAIKGTDLENADLVAIIKAAKASGNKKLFNNSAQVWNHDFFWRSLSPTGGGAPTGALAKKIDEDLGGLDKFKQTFAAEATGHFASGWAWLVVQNGKLVVTSYHDADSPIVHDDVTPLITADVWEHAYYLDYQNARPKFIETFLASLINWAEAAKNFEKAGK